MAESITALGEFLTLYITLPIVALFIIGWLISKYKKK